MFDHSIVVAGWLVTLDSYAQIVHSIGWHLQSHMNREFESYQFVLLIILRYLYYLEELSLDLLMVVRCFFSLHIHFRRQ